MSYWHRVGNALSQLYNALRGGHEDITTSADIHHPKNRFERLLKWALNRLDPGHTARAYRNDKDEFNG